MLYPRSNFGSAGGLFFGRLHLQTYFNYRPTRMVVVYTREEIERLLIETHTDPAKSTEVVWRDDGTVLVVTTPFVGRD
jgi:hypothetical protein